MCSRVGAGVVWSGEGTLVSPPWLNLIQGEKVAYVNNHETYGGWYRIPHDTRQRKRRQNLYLRAARRRAALDCRVCRHLCAARNHAERRGHRSPGTWLDAEPVEESR